jgi:hypothetical protein
MFNPPSAMLIKNLVVLAQLLLTPNGKFLFVPQLH